MLTNLVEESRVMKAFLVFAIAMSVVPQLLMEFRYFVPGFVFIRLHLKAFKWKDMAGEFLLYSLINYLTFNQYMYGRYELGGFEKRLMW
jgi:alpha-1,2-glucosyltransferase